VRQIRRGSAAPCTGPAPQARPPNAGQASVRAPFLGFSV